MGKYVVRHVGTNGSVWPWRAVIAMMIGGPEAAVRHLDASLQHADASRRRHRAHPGRGKNGGSAEFGHLHCGGNGASHFLKLVQDGIEYGVMAAYAQGMRILLVLSTALYERFSSRGEATFGDKLLHALRTRRTLGEIHG